MIRFRQIYRMASSGAATASKKHFSKVGESVVPSISGAAVQPKASLSKVFHLLRTPNSLRRLKIGGSICALLAGVTYAYPVETICENTEDFREYAFPIRKLRSDFGQESASSDQLVIIFKAILFTVPAILVHFYATVRLIIEELYEDNFQSPPDKLL